MAVAAAGSSLIDGSYEEKSFAIDEALNYESEFGGPSLQQRSVFALQHFVDVPAPTGKYLTVCFRGARRGVSSSRRKSSKFGLASKRRESFTTLPLPGTPRGRVLRFAERSLKSAP